MENTKTTVSYVTDDYGDSRWRAIVSADNGATYLAVIEAYDPTELKRWLGEHGYPLWAEVV